MLIASREQLQETLHAVGMNPVQLTGAAGQSLLVLPYGGRVLGLFPPASSRNFLWTNPALAGVQSANELYDGEKWHNSGGDRTWLAPELDYFFPAFPDTSTYVQPRQLDAGPYRVAASGSEVVLNTAFSLRSYRASVELSLGITKTASLIPDPLRVRRDAKLTGGLQFAGYQLHTSLRVLSPIPPQIWVGIWNLLQLPGGGELIAPTYFQATPTIFFGDIPAGYLQSEGRLVRFRMEAPGEQKICLSALATTGRLGYLYSDDDQLALVVRSFTVNPSGAYRDVWFTKPDDHGYAVQACNINTSTLGVFAEMEYHAPAIGGDTQCDRADDYSYVWAYRGEKAAIVMAARLLLGVEI